MILVAFHPHMRSTLVMRLLRELGANLLRDSIPAKKIGGDWVRPSGKRLHIPDSWRLFDVGAKNRVEVELPNLETDFYGKGINSAGYGPLDAVKMFGILGLKRCVLTPADRVVILVRDPDQVCESQAEKGTLEAHRKNMYRYGAFTEAWTETAPCPYLHFDVDALMENPAERVWALKEFCQLPGDEVLAASLVDTSLKREPKQRVRDRGTLLYDRMRAKCR